MGGNSSQKDRRLEPLGFERLTSNSQSNTYLTSQISTMPCLAQAMRALRRAHYVFPHSHPNTSSTAERQERWVGYLHVVGCTRTPKRQLKVSLASDLGQAVKEQSEQVRGYEGASCHNTSRIFLVMGLTPFCAGLRGSESAL
jgi:hypothetical protein